MQGDAPQGSCLAVEWHRMVRVPIKLYSATESRSTASAISPMTIEDREVPSGSETVKGYEVSSGSYITLSKEEIASADGPGARMIEIEHFARRDEIDPVYYERAYRLGPGKFGDEAYRLLHAALQQSGRVGIGRFVFHNKAQLVALRASEQVIALDTMRFADELVAPAEMEIPAPQRKPSKPEVAAARTLVDQLSSSFQPELYEDTYRDALLALIERKARGETIAAPAAEPIAPEDDLLGALQASLEQHGPRRRPHDRRKRSLRPRQFRSPLQEARLGSRGEATANAPREPRSQGAAEDG